MRSSSHLLFLTLGLASLTVACSSSENSRVRDTTRPTYNSATGKLVELTFDRNKNGVIDTWTAMEGSRMIGSRSDLNEDGTLDRWEYYDERGNLIKVGFARAGDGRQDAWAFAGADAKVERIEISSSGDPQRIDRWERYHDGVLVSAEDDTNGDGRADKSDTYEAGVLTTTAIDEDGDGEPDRRLTYSSGVLTLIESERDGSGVFRSSVTVR